MVQVVHIHNPWLSNSISFKQIAKEWNTKPVVYNPTCVLVRTQETPVILAHKITSSSVKDCLLAVVSAY